MRESIWGYAIVTLGILVVLIIWFISNATRTDQHNYNLLKETVEASMYDAIDLAEYRSSGTVKMDEQKFVESFILRFSESADLSNNYKIEIFDVMETPPKVSLRVTSTNTGNFKVSQSSDENFELNIINNIDAIIETKY